MAENKDSDTPGIPDLFVTSVIASGIAFLTLLLLFAILALFGSDPGSMLMILVYGGFYGLIITATLTIVLIAPLGTAIGLALQRFAPSGQWHGALIGAIMATILAMLVLSQGGAKFIQDGGNLVMITVFIAISSGAGWFAQRMVLRWPA
ncbi:MAG: hypothetical protein AAGK01_03750, partial [Pseudomonadota bacterium]